MSEITIYHNPRCSKSREALELIREQGIDPKVIKYLEEEIHKEDLKDVVHHMGIDVHDLVRRNEEAVCHITDEMSEDEVLDVIVKHPILLQRPLVIKGKKAIIARPAQKVKELL
jgi:arsenate reductase